MLYSVRDLDTFQWPMSHDVLAFRFSDHIIVAANSRPRFHLRRPTIRSVIEYVTSRILSISCNFLLASRVLRASITQNFILLTYLRYSDNLLSYSTVTRQARVL